MDLESPAGRPVAPVALAAHPETPAECVAVALDGGIDAFFFCDGTPTEFETKWP